MVKYFEKIWLVTQSRFGSGNLCGVNKSCKIVIEIFWKSIAAAWHKLMHKQWRAVGVALTFYNFNSSKKDLWIDVLSQSWTNPMHLLQAFGSLTLSWSCLPLVCLWDCKIVSAPKFIYGSLWIWCSLSYLVPAMLKDIANSLSMFYRCLRFKL